MRLEQCGQLSCPPQHLWSQFPYVIELETNRHNPALTAEHFLDGEIQNAALASLFDAVIQMSCR